MIQINLLPDNMKESSGSSPIGIIILIFSGILINCAVILLFGWLYFVMYDDVYGAKEQLDARLSVLKKKTQEYDKKKKERDDLQKKITCVRELIEDRVIWSMRLQDLAIFTNNQKVWFSKFSIKTKVPVVARLPKGVTAKGPTSPYSIIVLDGFSATKELSIPNDFRKDILATDWWKEHFQENGINNPSYSVKELNEKFYKEKFYQTFSLELSMKSKEQKTPPAATTTNTTVKTPGKGS